MISTREIPNEILLLEVSGMVSEGHSVILKTKGYSMLPFIHGWKDSVDLRLPENGYDVGDIVLAEIQKGHYVLHRVKSIDGQKVILKGDGNLYGEEHCLLQDLKAKAFFILRPTQSDDEGRRIECTSDRSKRRAARWNRLPVVAKRYFLAFYRRIARI